MNRASLESCIVAFGVSISLTPLVRYFSIRLGLFDPPGPLKIHRRPIPRLGGIAIASAIAISCLSTRSLSSGAASVFLSSLALVWLVGLIDDLRGLSPMIRIIFQAAAGLLLWRGGWHFPAIGTSGWNAAATCALAILFINAFNFLDGSDGLAAGVAATMALFFVLAQPHPVEYFGIGVAWSLLGATAGFLVFNAPLPRASIFMGDSGSTALGFTIAFLAVNSSRFAPPAPPSALFPILVAGLPLFDAALAVVRRVRSGRSPFRGDRQHFYDILLTRGWSPRKVALVSYVITAALGGIGLAGFRLQPKAASMLTGATFGLLLVAAIRIGSLDRTPNVALSSTESLQKQFEVAEGRKSTAIPPFATAAAAREVEVTMSD